MRVPLSWLSELVPIDLPEDELLETMGRNGLEVEEVRRPGAGVSGVTVARVLEVNDHPDADKLVVVRIESGDGERTVCAGARNIRAGDVVPYAAPGATLPHPDGTMEIGRRTMRGITSEGMLCSARELQVADDHAGIMVLAEDLAVGSDISDHLPLGEPVIDVAVPADRGDLHSVIGIARDLAAILDVDLVTPPDPREHAAVQGDFGDVPVRIDAEDGCSLYVGWVVEDLAVGPSPWWLRRRLEVCGVRSISNLVDVTNYVMLERGQPLHAFDLDHLRGPEIVVRWAGSGETLRTLDGRDRRLAADDLVIADADRVVALAGVMGGEETEVGGSTSRILLEAAAFAPAAVRRTSRALGLVSEASIRFERRVDPAGSVAAAARAVGLLADTAGGRDSGMRVSGKGDPEVEAIDVDPARIAAFVGLPELDTESQAALLRRADVTVETDGDRLRATPPSWRADLRRPADLAEEVARLHGYERIPAVLPSLGLRGGLTARQRAEREVRATVRAAGLHEAQSSPFVDEEAASLLVPDLPDRVRLENPLAKDTAVMRPGLVESLLQTARRNAGQGRAGLGLFEVARIFHHHGGPLDATLAQADVPLWTDADGEHLPTQPFALGLLAYGHRQGRGWVDRTTSWGVFDLLGVVDDVAALLDPDGAPLERESTTRPGLHEGRTTALLRDGALVGVVGQIDPREADRRDVPESTVVGEILLEVLWSHLLDGEALLRLARPITRHPAVAVDVAVVVDDEVTYAQVRDAVRDGAQPLLVDLRLFDEYRGEQVGEGRRSLAFSLRLQSEERQLTDADAEKVIDHVEEAVGRIGGTLRR